MQVKNPFACLRNEANHLRCPATQRTPFLGERKDRVTNEAKRLQLISVSMKGEALTILRFKPQ